VPQRAIDRRHRHTVTIGQNVSAALGALVTDVVRHRDKTLHSGSGLGMLNELSMPLAAGSSGPVRQGG